MTTLLEKYNEPLTRGMSLLTFIVFFGFQLIGKIVVAVFNINETMGWKWSVIHTWIDTIPIYSLFIFFGVYLIFNLLKIKTNPKLSAIHLSMIGLSSFLYSFWELDLRITLFLICFSFIIFGMNLYKALFHKENI